MPFYISSALVTKRYGEEFAVNIADRDADVDQDRDAVACAIRDAEAEVNSYVAKRYALPLPGIVDIPDPTGPLETNAFVPPELRRVAVDIAVYRLASEHDKLTKERRRRYEDAMKWLKLLCEEKVSLTTNPPTAGGVTREGPCRIFTRDKMDGLI